VNFIADEDASFVIEIRKSDLILDINEAYFENVSFLAYNDSLAIDSCMFKHSEIGFYRTNDEYFVVSNSVFDTTYFTASVDETSLNDNGNVVVSDCKFITDKGDAVININIYKNFQLLRDTIVFNTGDGISLSNSGSSVGQISQVKDCYVNYRGDPSVDTSRGINIYHSYTDIENYYEAEGKFKEIIEDHPESKYIQASVKELLVLKRIHDQDFEGLQNYLDSIPTLWEDEITANVTDHVINWCNIEKEDYVAAIIWFEDQIENPKSYADSICAIIDLGYTYTLMDTTSNKSSGFIGNYPQYRPTSRTAYEKNREYLVDLLFRRKSHSNEEESKPLQSATFNLHQNYPNPVREATTIKYTISEQSYVILKIYNTLGSLVTTLVNETQREGEKQVTFNIQNLPNSSYYYCLEVDGEIIGVRKMVVLKLN